MTHENYSPPAAWELKPAGAVEVGDSICSLGPVERIDGPDEDGYLEVSFAHMSAATFAAEDATGRKIIRPVKLIWSPCDPVAVVTPEVE